jgi:nucleotide-binding universal stress UspA family protein
MYELRRILVPTDFSKHAVDALEHAVTLGDRYNAEITLLHVDEYSVSSLGGQGVMGNEIAAYLKRKAAFVDEQFSLLRRAVAGRRVRLVPQVLSGRAYKVIVEESERQDYDLIVIATRGVTHLSTYLIGSTAERVVRLSRQPVLSIQGGPVYGGKMTSVLCPTDLSPAANVALSYALSMARQFDATLFVQYISELEKPESRDEVMKRIPDLEEHLPDAKNVKVEFIFDRDVEPSNSIIRFAEDRDVGLIVMSTHGRKGLRRVYIGNNTAEVVRQSTRPVLTVTHPFHKKMFARPVTVQSAPKIPGAEPQGS